MSAERLEYTEEKAKILVVDDYAENPTVLEFILRTLDVVCYERLVAMKQFHFPMRIGSR
jgi:UDP-N-acetylmuramate-alanine ligase